MLEETPLSYAHSEFLGVLNRSHVGCRSCRRSQGGGVKRPGRETGAAVREDCYCAKPGTRRGGYGCKTARVEFV